VAIARSGPRRPDERRRSLNGASAAVDKDQLGTKSSAGVWTAAEGCGAEPDMAESRVDVAAAATITRPQDATTVATYMANCARLKPLRTNIEELRYGATLGQSEAGVPG
jgi:hypothetical protein